MTSSNAWDWQRIAADDVIFGLEEIDDGVWPLYFGSLLLGRFHEDDLKLHGARLD